MPSTSDEATADDRDLAVARWGADGFFFSEAARGGPLAWRVGQSRLEGEVLGPVRHAHDGAAEYYFMFSGSAHIETGGEESVLEEGQLAYIPPDVPHNFLGPASDRDACLFCVVAPNFAANKWRVDGFRPDTEHLRKEAATPFHDEALPGDDTLAAHALELSSDTPPLPVTPAGFEIVYLVVAGQAELSLANGLRGKLIAGTYIHLREGLAHRLEASVPSRVLRIDCRFEAWQGVPLAPDSPKSF